MDAAKFLLRVLPDPGELGSGYISVHWHRPGQPFLGRSFSTFAQVLTFLFSTEIRSNLYFCVSLQSEDKGHRSQKNALAFRSVFFDVDVKPGSDQHYQSTHEAIAAIFLFCQALGIPNPSAMVASGSGGIHVYWFSDRPLGVDKWRAYAEGLKVAARNHELKVDLGLTTDAARVLRIPDTWNFKHEPPRRVRVLPRHSPGAVYDFAGIFTWVNSAAVSGDFSCDVLPGPEYTPAPGLEEPNANQPKLAPRKILQLPPPSGTATAFAHLDPQENLGEGIPEQPPVPSAPVLAGCEWLRTALETGGKEYDQPQWNLTTLCCTFMENGHDLAHAMGNAYPTYSFGETEGIWHRKLRERRAHDLGWPRCSIISDNGSRFCQSCEHFAEHSAKGKSPLHLAAAQPTLSGDDEGLEPSDEEKALRLPEAYRLLNGFIHCVIPNSSKGIPLPPIYSQLLRSKVSDPRPAIKDNEFGLEFSVIMDSARTIDSPFIPIRDISGAAFINQLKAQQVLLIEDDPQLDPPKRVKHMLRLKDLGSSWLAKLRDEENYRELGSMGWRIEDGRRVGFTYADTLYRANGASEKSRLPSSDELFKWYFPKGRKEPWLRAAKLLTDRKRPELDIIISVAFAAPLMAFAGTVYGGILSVWGEPGTAKSTAQQVAAAVWGHPKQTRESLNSSQKSILNRLGKTKNLAGYWDDIQDEFKQEHLFQAMFVAAEGTEGGRLTPDVSHRARLDWQTMMIVCSNASFTEYILKKQPSTTAGLRRVLEFEFNKPTDNLGMIDEFDANQIFAELEHNYGQIGTEYAQLLAFKYDEVADLTEETIKRFKKRVFGKVEEAYWWTIAGVLIAGATLARRLGAEMDVAVMEEFLVSVFLANQDLRNKEGTEGGSKDNTLGALSQFLKHYVGQGNVIVTDVAWEPGKSIRSIFNPLLGRPVYVHVITDQHLVRISKKIFRQYLREQKIQPRQVLNGLGFHFVSKEKRATLAAGTVFAVMQEDVIELSSREKCGPLLEELLTAHGAVKYEDWERVNEPEPPPY